MGSGRDTCWSQLLLVASLAFFVLISLTASSPLELMSAPNLLRAGTAENIFVEIQDCERKDDRRVQISVMNFPTKTQKLASTYVTLTKAKNYQDFGRITIPAEAFSNDPNIKQFVYLQAQFPDRVLEKVVLVSFLSGYIFIQTDKPIYNQESKIFYRIFAVNPAMEPVEANHNTHTVNAVDIEIVSPGGLTVESNFHILRSGIFSGSFSLSANAANGPWQVVAKFRSNPQMSFAAKFEVKEYVLPSFEVKLTPLSSFYYVDREGLTLNIQAMYFCGKEVDGTAYVVFGFIHRGQKISFPSSLQSILIVGGNVEVTLKKETITQTFPNVLDLVGSSIYATVSVLTESGGEMVEAELRGIKIIASPYTITFKKTPKYFKPGMPFDVVVEVMNPDDTPAQGIAVLVEPGAVRGITAANGMAKVTIHTVANSEILTITARTNDPRISFSRQTSATMNAYPYKTKSNSYIHISVDTTEVELGQYMKINLFFNRPQSQQKDITYLFLSRGQLVRYQRQKSNGMNLISQLVQITKEMLPSFRIIAYFHPSSDEVVSDSVWVNVKDTCLGMLKLEVLRPAASYEPRQRFAMQVTGDPEATVGLMAVDKRFDTFNRHLLTQKKIWDMVEKYDTGCTPGGGKDSMNVFYDAGLLFETSTIGTPYRTDLKCSAPSRRKRAITPVDLPMSEFEEKIQKECCLDGMRNVSVSYTCERHSKHIVDSPACMEAFMRCCKEIERHRAERKEGTVLLARSKRLAQNGGEENNEYMDNNEILTRVRFPESWFLNDIKLSACPRTNPNCVFISSVKQEFLPDSVTSWQFTGISLSRTHGICVADPLEIIVQKNFFIDLKLPYSAVHGEQLEIKAILHNYYPNPITVRVDLLDNDYVCSAAYKQRMYRQVVQVGAKTTRSVPFVIVPLRNEMTSIEVKASVRGMSVADGIRRMLHVVPAGTLGKSWVTLTLDPSTKGIDGRQVEIIASNIPSTDVAPNTPSSTVISLTGREHIALLLKKVISGESVSSLIREPSGSGEENVISMSLPVIATIYLDNTNQWESVGLEKRNEAIEHMIKGYQNELAFRKTDGSFYALPNSQSGTWLTAYVAKVFAMAHKLMAVERSVICDAIKFLILKTQRPNGMFFEMGHVTGDVAGTDSDASLTAFCLIAMQESRDLCLHTVYAMPSSIDHAVAYLEQRLPGLTNPYAVTITSYALANENKLNKEILYKFAARDRSHWPVPKGNVYTLEATAYALRALVKTKASEEAKHTVQWLSQQQRLDGGYGSTQATVLLYQAVSEYWTSVKESEYNLDVEVMFSSRSRRYNFNRGNQHVTRTISFYGINKDVKVTATGMGEIFMTMVSYYYTLPQEKERDCEKFNLNVQVLPQSEDEKIYKLQMQVLFKNKDRNASLSVLDVGLPTGFTFNKNDLDTLSRGHDRIIAKYDTNTALSERGSLIIYLDKISNTRPEEISFRIHQATKLGRLQPAAVSVYEYYDQEHCVKFYQPDRINGELLRLCNNGQCVCAEENSCMQRKEKISNDERLTKSCETTPGNKIDFVYKVRVDEFSASLSADIYKMQIMEAIKEGSVDLALNGKIRTFLGYIHCRELLDLRASKTYLIMGSSADIYKEEQTFQYVLGEKTWIEYWPTDTECSIEAQYRHTCKGLEELAFQHAIFGCAI
ncbi:complement C3-like isoform X2 [Leuresthes tenuis]|uniref:complement C3-like isoform X2 n=1 Tax=Leuresthes tenuis TaxID=355514 RepID=UPI003B5059D0